MQKILPPSLLLTLSISLIALVWMGLSAASSPHQIGIPHGEVLISASMGLVMLMGARNQLRIADEQIQLFKMPGQLVTQGLYGVSRNPMYLGFLLLLIAAALYVDRLPALVAPLSFFVAANWWSIPAEEKAVRERFGERYDQYTHNVRRWI
jgi:protein-S-isoprenylcysteine O-methyltransferase Ste14